MLTFEEIVRPGLEQVITQFPRYTAVASDGCTLQIFPTQENRVTSMPWSFRILNDQDKSWVYYQGIGGTKLRFGPDVENLTIEWVHETATRFVSDTLRGLRV